MNGDSSLVVQAPSLFPAHPIASAAVQPVDSVRGDDNDHDQQTSSPFDGSPQINSNSSNSQLLTSSDASTVSSQVADDTNNKLRQMSSGDEQQQQQHQQRQQRELEMAKVDGGALLEHVNGQIELVEHTPDAATSTLDDSREWAPDNDYELKRVKVRPRYHHSMNSFTRFSTIFISPLSAGLRAHRFTLGRPRHSVLFRSISRRHTRGVADRKSGAKLQRHHSLHNHKRERRLPTTARCVLLSFQPIQPSKFPLPSTRPTRMTVLSAFKWRCGR